jgi:hypothetical protein
MDWLMLVERLGLILADPPLGLTEGDALADIDSDILGLSDAL